MREEIKRVGRRLYIWGFVIAFGYSYSLAIMLFHLVFRLESRVFHVTANIAIFLNGAVFFPAIVWILRHRYLSLRRKALQWEESADAEERLAVSESIRADAERYPLDMAVLAVIIVAYFYVFVGITWYIVDEVPGGIAFAFCAMGLAVAIGFLVIFLSMYTTILERTREIGVLKALGASRGFIVRVVLSESTLICLAGIVFGYALAVAVRDVFTGLFPTLTILLHPDWMVRAAGLAVAAGLAGAAYPAWLASRKDPIEALAYE